MNKSISKQKKRYDEEASQHSQHYNDKYTQLYRDEFIRVPLFKENLNGLYILDAMCASGIETVIFSLRVLMYWNRYIKKMSKNIIKNGADLVFK